MTPMDVHSFAFPAHLKALLVPIGDITSEEFSRYAEIVRSSSEVRLVDVTPTKTKLFNPQGFPNGRVIYSFNTSLSDQESLFLHDFEPFRKTFVVIGITKDATTSADHIKQLSSVYKSVITHTAIVFGSKTESDRGDGIFFHSNTNIETILCDITRLLLDRLSNYLTSYQHLTLRSPGSISENERGLSKQKKRISSGSAISLSLSDPSHSKISLSTANERRQFKVKGRQQKTLGNLLLLAGKYNDALKEFSEAVVLLKASNDYLWLGSTLEGIAVCLVMLHFVEVSYQLPAHLVNLLNKYKHSHTSTSSETPSPSPRASTSSLSNSPDIIDLATPELVAQILNEVLFYYELSRNDPEDYAPNLVYCESILRFTKFQTAINVAGDFNLDVLDSIVKSRPLRNPVRNNYLFDRLDILKLTNKLFTVELRKMNILSQTRIYSSLSSIYDDLGYVRKRGFILRTLFVSLIPELTKFTTEHSTNSLDEILKTLLRIYGIPDSQKFIPEDSLSKRWTLLHKSVIRLCIIICDKLEDKTNVLKLRISFLTRYLNSLSDNEQIKLHHDIQNSLSADNSMQKYYDLFLVRGVESLNRTGIPNRVSKDLELKSSNDPLIYNPYSAKEGSRTASLVQGEISELIVKVQNPFAFELEVNDIKLENMEIIKSHYIIPPKSICSLSVPARPLKYGKLQIDHITLQLFKFPEQEFHIIDETTIERVSKIKHSFNSSSFIYPTYEEKSSQDGNQVQDRATTKNISFDVIPTQSNLQLLSSFEPIMLLEGGERLITIKLRNNSPTIINHLSFSIWDSTTEALKEALENKSLPPNEIHEIEYFLFKQPFELLTEVTEIQPFQEVELEARLLGKRGLKKVNFLIDYGREVEGEIYTKRLEVPLTIVVNTCIDLAACDIVPLTQEVKSTTAKFWQFINESDCQATHYALFLLDLRNVWNKPLSINVNFDGYEIKEEIVPLETKRLVIPIKCFSIAVESLKPIPRFFKKQHVVSKFSKVEDLFQRESYWYRDQILNKLSGSWSVNDVQGRMEFRGVRLSQRMLNILKLDDISVFVSLKDVEFEKKGVENYVKIDEFFTVNVKVQNASNRDIKGILRNVPVSTNYGIVEKRILFNGALQNIMKSPLKPGNSLEFDIGVVILEKGDYEWGVIFDEFNNEHQHVSRTPLRIKAF